MTQPNGTWPAFPSGSVATGDGETVAYTMGMTMRDYFAAEATPDADRITAELADALVGPLDQSTASNDPIYYVRRKFLILAKLKYLEADAMIKAREDAL